MLRLSLFPPAPRYNIFFHLICTFTASFCFVFITFLQFPLLLSHHLVRALLKPHIALVYVGILHEMNKWYKMLPAYTYVCQHSVMILLLHIDSSDLRLCFCPLFIFICLLLFFVCAVLLLYFILWFLVLLFSFYAMKCVFMLNIMCSNCPFLEGYCRKELYTIQ